MQRDSQEDVEYEGPGEGKRKGCDGISGSSPRGKAERFWHNTYQTVPGYYPRLSPSPSLWASLFGGTMLVAGVSGSLQDSIQSVAKARKFPRVYATVGVHPTRCSEFEEIDGEVMLNELLKLATSAPGEVVAIGEIGLDYDREQVIFQDTE